MHKPRCISEAAACHHLRKKLVAVTQRSLPTLGRSLGRNDGVDRWTLALNGLHLHRRGESLLGSLHARLWVPERSLDSAEGDRPCLSRAFSWRRPRRDGARSGKRVAATRPLGLPVRRRAPPWSRSSKAVPGPSRVRSGCAGLADSAGSSAGTLPREAAALLKASCVVTLLALRLEPSEGYESYVTHWSCHLQRTLICIGFGSAVITSRAVHAAYPQCDAEAVPALEARRERAATDSRHPPSPRIWSRARR